MIDLVQKADIILSYIRDGKNYSQIERETGITRKTVTKYIEQFEQKKQELLEKGHDISDTELLIKEMIEAPKYDTSNRRKRKLTPEILEKIDHCLKENQMKRAAGRSKQQMKKIDIYENLKRDGFDISYPTVVRAVRERQKLKREAFIKQEYDYGDICEFDWGEVKLTIAGEDKRIQMAVFTSAKGNYRHAIMYPTQKMECFLDAHAAFFDSIQGVYATMVYDNMKTAVKRFVGRSEKEPTEELLKLSLYYGFKYRFCNVRKGNEKGHVERSVEYIRRKAFSKRDTFQSLEEANTYLNEELQHLNTKPQVLKQGKSAQDIFAVEKQYLLPIMPKYDTARTSTLRVDSYSTIIVDECRYSVPDHLVGEYVFAKIYPTKIIIYDKNKQVACHRRKYGLHEWSLDLFHYLGTIKKKPGALLGSLAFKQTHQRLQKIYQMYYTKKEKDFVDLLGIISETGLEKVEQAIKRLQQISPMSITTEKIKVLCNRKEETKYPVLDTEDEIIKRANEILQSYGALLDQGQGEFHKEVGVI